MLLYRPVGLNELRLIYQAAMKSFPPRLPEQPIFYPVLGEAYAEQIARDWNTRTSPFAGYVTRFSIGDDYASRFETRQVGSAEHRELWVPAEELGSFNHHIDGRIEIWTAWFGSGFRGAVPDRFMLAGRDARAQLSALAGILECSGMDFVCEVAANHEAVFLNFAYWLALSPADAGLPTAGRDAVLAAIRKTWGEEDARPGLPAPGQLVA
jgi:hypothetical protein